MLLEVVHQRSLEPVLFTLRITFVMMVCALLALKSKESRSQDNIAMLRCQIVHHLRRILQSAWKRITAGRRLCASAPFHGSKPFSISSFALLLVNFFFDLRGM